MIAVEGVTLTGWDTVIVVAIAIIVVFVARHI